VGVWGRGSSEGPNWSPGLLDRAETFAESDLTVSPSTTRVNNEEIEIFGEEAYTPANLSVSGEGNVNSMDIALPDEATTVELDATLYLYAAGGVGRAYINGTQEYSKSDDSGVDESTTSNWATTIDISEYSAPKTLTLEVEQTDTWTNDGASGTVELQDQSHRAYPTGALSGSAVLEWSMPADLAGWDIIPYEATEDGGTVEVYTIDPSDGTRLTGALDDPGDISGLSRSTNVAVEVVLERPSTSENPRLEAVYRRRKIT